MSQDSAGDRALPKYKQVAAMIRDQVTGGMLLPGEPAPSGAALARATGYSTLTCRRALRTLVTAGVLAPGASRNARPRVPSPDRRDRMLSDAKRELSAALADRRHAAGLTQPQLAEITGDSVTAIGHAETGRLWNSRPFWERVDKALNADGELLRLYGAYRAAEVAEPAPVAEGTVPGIAEAAEAQSVAEQAPVPVALLIMWSDGAITRVPVNREMQAES